MRLVQLLALATWREWLQVLAWRAFLVTLVINQVVVPLLGLAVWSAALPGDIEVARYYVALLAVQLLTVSYEHHTFANGIYAGDLSPELLKPQPVVVGVLGTNLALRAWHLVIGLPVIVGALWLTAASFDAGHVLASLPALALAAAVRFVWTYSLALAAFWTEQAHGVVGFGETLIFLLGGAAAPVALFPAAWRPLGEALPFYAMLGFPAEIAAGSLSGEQILAGYAWQALWLLVGVALARGVWGAGLRRYTAVGG
jgi:ABC-2 type transport system permease protein